MPNIIFFDLVKNSENEFTTTKDKELFENSKFKTSLKNGLSELINLINSGDCETRVGLVGRNTAGIFLKGHNDSNQIDNSPYLSDEYHKEKAEEEGRKLASIEGGDNI